MRVLYIFRVCIESGFFPCEVRKFFVVGRIHNSVLSPSVSLLHHVDVGDPETISVFVTVGSKS